MRSLNNRLMSLEQTMQPDEEPPGAYVVIKNNDGTATVMLPNNGGKKHFENDDKTSEYLNNQALKDTSLNVLIVNSQGEMPHVS